MAQNKRKGVQPASSGMKPFYMILGLVLFAGAGFIVYSMMNGAKTATQPIDQEILSASELLSKAQGISRGPANAPVKVLVFADYTCPACARHALEFEPIFRDSLLSSGKVQEVFYDFPLGGVGEHKHSFLAARAGRCANEQNKFWEYHHVLFQKQREWAYGPNAPTKQLLDYGEEVGLDGKAFEACVKSEKYADVVTASHQLGTQLDVGSTPTIIVNGQIPQWRTWNDLKDVMKRAAGI